MNANQRSLRIELLGRVPYGPMLALQEARHAEVLAGTCPDTLFLLEHEPVVTLGKNSGDRHVLVSAQDLAAQGIELFATGRGGDVTYHGPGQVVGYPVVALGPREQDVQDYVYRLEEIMIRAALDFGVVVQRVPGLRGVWVEDAKVGAVGVRIANWVTMHGFALNVSRQLPGFRLIVPCGLTGKRITSLEEILGRKPPMPEVMERLATHAAAVLGRRRVDQPPTKWRVAPDWECAPSASIGPLA